MGMKIPDLLATISFSLLELGITRKQISNELDEAHASPLDKATELHHIHSAAQVLLRDRPPLELIKSLLTTHSIIILDTGAPKVVPTNTLTYLIRNYQPVSTSRPQPVAQDLRKTAFLDSVGGSSTQSHASLFGQ